MLYVIIVSIFLLISTSSYAMELVLGAGISKATMPFNGIWYHKNPEFPPYSADMTNKVMMLGLRHSINERWRVNVGVTNLGTYHLDAWASPADSNYDSKKQRCIGECLPPVNYKTTGSLAGIVSTVEWHTKHIGIEAGPFVYKARFIVDVPGWYHPEGTPGNYVIKPEHFRPIYSDDMEWQLGSLVGLSYHKQDWSVRLLVIFDKQGFRGHNDPWVPNWRRHNVFLIQKAF